MQVWKFLSKAHAMQIFQGCSHFDKAPVLQAFGDAQYSACEEDQDAISFLEEDERELPSIWPILTKALKQ